MDAIKGEKKLFGLVASEVMRRGSGVILNRNDPATYLGRFQILIVTHEAVSH